MIHEQTLRSQHAKIKAELEALNAKRKEIQKALESLGLTENQKRKLYNVEERTVFFRQNLLDQLYEIEQQQSVLIKKRKELGKLIDETEQKIIKRMFREMFSVHQLEEIGKEARRRAEGEHPIPLGFDFKELERYKEGYYKYRNLSKEQISKMIEFRIKLTMLIEQGCKQFGDAEFLKFISPLNKMILPLQELEKIKKKFLL
jgi:uncharacterized protein (DUF3084 family)